MAFPAPTQQQQLAQQANFARTAANTGAAAQAAPQGRPAPAAQAYAPTAANPAQAANYQQAMNAERQGAAPQSPFGQVAGRLAPAPVPMQTPQGRPGVVPPAVTQRPGGQPGLTPPQQGVPQQVPQAAPTPFVPRVARPIPQSPNPQATAQADALARNQALQGAAN